MLRLARLAAIAISVGTFAFLFINNSWRADNLFLVPDLILCALLLVAAILPARHAPAALVFAFGYTAGVLSCSVADYAVRGELGMASLIGALVSGLMACLLLRQLTTKSAGSAG
ncbi:MAG: hypothetical protein ACQRW7_03635 [Caulobacterales bacterium]|uniref:hypothetical protein n=1 Tax=Glycocaulis sp. TaxID=1969725 RepID=UPI003F9EBEE6